MTHRTLRQGELILECPPASIVLDRDHRRSRCGYCAVPIPNSSSPLAASENKKEPVNRNTCRNCLLVCICDKCDEVGLTRWHEDSGECRALGSLVKCHAALFGSAKDGDDAGAVDSSHVLAVRLLVRRWNERARKRPTAAAAPSEENRNDDRVSNGGSPTKNLTKKIRPPLPAVDWDLFDLLHTADVAAVDDSDRFDAAIEALCRLLREEFAGGGPDPKWDGSWLMKDSYLDALGKIVGCAHALTDVTLKLGCQCLGRALFLQQSFYNHSCVPNAFLSCHIGPSDPSRAATVGEAKRHGLFARVHSLEDIPKGRPVTLSYIPTSGLDRTERQRMLREGYQFDCNCIACSLATPRSKAWEGALQVPPDSDLHSLRGIQYDCNEALLQALKMPTSIERTDLVDRSIRTIDMVRKGLNNQRIPSSHECTLETHRLRSEALHLSKKLEESAREHRLFLEGVAQVAPLIDPVAIATQRAALAETLNEMCDSAGAKNEIAKAMALAGTALGEDHALVVSLQTEIEPLRLSQEKKRKLEGILAKEGTHH